MGMEPLKEFVRKMVKDATNRRMLGDSAKLRHILVSGELGTGKSTAAEHICEMLKLTGGIKTHSEEVPEWDDGKWESKAKHACAARSTHRAYAGPMHLCRPAAISLLYRIASYTQCTDHDR